MSGIASLNFNKNPLGLHTIDIFSYPEKQKKVFTYIPGHSFTLGRAGGGELFFIDILFS